MIISESKLIIIKSIVLFKKPIEPIVDHFFNNFTYVSQQRYWSIVNYFSLHPFSYTGIVFPILRIARNLPSENIRFIRSFRVSLRAFLDCLNSLFGMLEGPVLLLFLRIFMQECTTSVLVGSKLNVFFIGLSK